MTEKRYAYYEFARSEMLPFVPKDACRILDIGCGTARFAELLRSRAPCEVWGIEPDLAAGDMAAPRLDHLLRGHYPEIGGLPSDYFDCIVFNDVLEHMPDPWRALEATKRYLTPQGVVVASIPNVRYLPVLYQLIICGDWAYGSAGVLDRTHLRFFTKKSIKRLFQDTGYALTRLEGISPYHRWQQPLLRLMLPPLVRDLTCIDYAVVARPAGRKAHMGNPRVAPFRDQAQHLPLNQTHLNSALGFSVRFHYNGLMKGATWPMVIHILPQDVAAKIAAGEVVERPESAVKELIENSIDAGATDIRIEIAAGGKRLIRISDNGCGIPADQVELAFARHATSKLQTAEELDHIRTLGFRGEALASIAAVSRLTMTTRAADNELGLQIRLEGGQVTQRRPVGVPIGTIVAVENLFFNTPARLKFLRTDATEAGRISDLVSSYALAYPELRFSLVNNGRITLQTTGTGDLYDALVKVYGLDLAQRMLACRGEEEALSVSGYVSVPDLHRSNRKGIILFCNRRWIQDPSLSYAVEQAYHGLLMKGRHPLAVVDLRVPPNALDVNIHPTKREVRFQNSRQVFALVQRAIRATLRAEAPMPSLSHQATAAPPSSWQPTGQRVWHPQPERAASSQLAIDLHRTAQPGDMPDGSASQRPTERLPMLRVIGQIGQTYIIAEGPGGMYLIDQHAAHERVVYERMMAERQKADQATSQSLLDPPLIELSPGQSAQLAQHLDGIASLGFQIEPFGVNTFRVLTVPPDIPEGSIPAAIADILDETESGALPWAEEALTRLVCHSAVRAGQTLSLPEMRDLVRQLEQTATPHSCPHGRPTMIHLSAAQLEREFGRR